MRRNQRRTTCRRLVNLDFRRFIEHLFLDIVLLINVRFTRLSDSRWKIETLWWLFPYIFLRLRLILGKLWSRQGRWSWKIFTNFSTKTLPLRSPLEIWRLLVIILACDSRGRKFQRFQLFFIIHYWVYSEKEAIWKFFNLIKANVKGWRAICQVFRIWGIHNP